MIQKTEWGSITWLHLSDKNDFSQSLIIGITQVLPGKKQARHFHYGHEQFLYVLSGEGYYMINDKKIPYKQGQYVYLPANASHETVAFGDSPTVELMVANPVFCEGDIDFSLKKEEEDTINKGGLLYASVEAIHAQLAAIATMPVTIFDDNWDIVSETGSFPDFCMSKCGVLRNRKECPCMKLVSVAGLEQAKSLYFTCPYGLTIIQIQIVYNHLSLGVIRGGHILLSEDETSHDGISVTPQGTEIGIQKTLMRVATSILKFCEFNESRQELMKKNAYISLTEKNQIELEKNLSAAHETVTNLKINHHFLFNTLNSMADMALTGTREDLYHAIIDLAKMFRYTMTTNLRFVTVQAEMEYLGTYLNLQRLRYRDNLVIAYDIPEQLQEVMVPFNFLQPIVENAFTHGFALDDAQRLIWIKAKKQENYMEISVQNNGSNVDAIVLNRVKKSLSSNTGHGLSFIYAKLKLAYGSDFEMDIISNEENKTLVTVKIPVEL